MYTIEGSKNISGDVQTEEQFGAVADAGVPWVPRNPVFVVLHTCVAGLVRVHEHSRNPSGQLNPPCHW